MNPELIKPVLIPALIKIITEHIAEITIAMLEIVLATELVNFLQNIPLIIPEIRGKNTINFNTNEIFIEKLSNRLMFK